MPINRLAEKEKVSLYAKALFEGAQSRGGQDGVLEIREHAEQCMRHIRSNMNLAIALRDSAYSPQQRGGLAREVFKGFNGVLVSVLAIMAERDEISLLRQIREEYEQLIEERLNLTVVDVVTVVSLDDRLRALIEGKVATDLGKSVVLYERVDPSILGGIIMSVQGKRLDVSVKSQLENARSVLKTTTDGGEGQ